MKKALVTTIVMVAMMCGITAFISVTIYLILNYANYIAFGFIIIVLGILLVKTWTGIYEEVDKYYKQKES